MYEHRGAQWRSLVLVEAGQHLALALGAGFEAIARGGLDAREANAGRGLRVTCTPFLAERVLMPRLAEFWTAHPGAEISLSPTRTYADVTREGFDLALRALLPYQTHGQPGAALDAEVVKEITLIGIASPVLIAQRGDAPDALPWLWHDVMDLKLRMMENCGLEIKKIEQVRIGSANLLVEAVRQGLGVTIFNEAMARDEIAAGGIVELPLPHPGKVTYHALTPKGPKHPLVAPS